MAWQERLRASGDYVRVDYARFDRAYQIDWLGGMCDRVGIPRLADDEAVTFAHLASQFVCRSVRSAFPGAVEAIRTLHAQGYLLYTASAESSRELTGYLEGMGVRDCFKCLYGPDIIATFKAGPAYYERLLADAGVSPTRALIVDDSPKATAWARVVGAQTVLVGSVPDAQGSAVIESLAALPNLLAGWAY
jgi:phosphoglycolate phosphatase